MNSKKNGFEPLRPKRKRRWILVALAVCAGLGLAAVLICDRVVTRAGRDACFATPDQVPHCRVGIVLGAAPNMTDGHVNLFCRNRIDAAAALQKAGRVDYLLISGDNGRKDYDEPTWIRDELIRRGVPASRIYRDYAGFRTLDTVIRARTVFGLDECVFISQRFHNERALYLARHHGLRAWALDAADVAGRDGMRTRLREKLARVAAVLDAVFNRGPKFQGPPVHIGATRAGQEM